MYACLGDERTIWFFVGTEVYGHSKEFHKKAGLLVAVCVCLSIRMLLGLHDSLVWAEFNHSQHAFLTFIKPRRLVARVLYQGPSPKPHAIKHL